MKIFSLKPEYEKYLSHLEADIFPKNHLPDFGIVIEIHNKKYFIPLSSGRPRNHSDEFSHKDLKKSNPTLYYLVKNNRYLGALKLNHMIPVTDEVILQPSIKALQEQGVVSQKYTGLLNQQRMIAKKQQPEIKVQAEQLYDLVVTKKNDFFRSISLDFSELEKALDRYL